MRQVVLTADWQDIAYQRARPQKAQRRTSHHWDSQAGFGAKYWAMSETGDTLIERGTTFMENRSPMVCENSIHRFFFCLFDQEC
jgi:hypothetical protein